MSHRPGLWAGALSGLSAFVALGILCGLATAWSPADSTPSTTTTPAKLAGLWTAHGAWGVARITEANDSHLAGTFTGALSAASRRPGSFQLSPMDGGFGGSWREVPAGRCGFMWLRPGENGKTVSGWVSWTAQPEEASSSRRTPVVWHRLPEPRPARVIEGDGLRIEIYDQQPRFLARLAGAVRRVTFDDIPAGKRDLAYLASDHYAASHGLVITGQARQYVSRSFGYPKNYIAVSKPNMFAPGPAASYDFLAPLRDRLRTDRSRLLSEFEKTKAVVRDLDGTLEQTRSVQTAGRQARLRESRAVLSGQLAQLRAIDHQLGALGSGKKSTGKKKNANNGTSPHKVRGSGGGHTTTLTFLSNNRPANVTGFGAFFIDVDYPYLAPSGLAIFDARGRLIARDSGFPGHNARGVFRGVIVCRTDGRPVPAIARVVITSGGEWPGYGAGEGVALDDFFFGTPQPRGGRAD